MTCVMQTSDLTGAALDWAVCNAEGLPVFDPDWNKVAYSYSSDWAQGGPIIEREKISIDQRPSGPCRAFLGVPVKCEHAMFAPEGKPLVAAMRCFVASRLGADVAIPGELRAGN